MLVARETGMISEMLASRECKPSKMLQKHEGGCKEKLWQVSQGSGSVGC